MSIQDKNGQINTNADTPVHSTNTDADNASFDQAFFDQTSQVGLINQADDLKGLLQQIAKQIADVDKRHSVSLRDMHERLAAIGERAEQVGADVPCEFQPAFERIGDAVSQLSDRLSLADKDRLARHDQGLERLANEGQSPLPDSTSATADTDAAAGDVVGETDAAGENITGTDEALQSQANIFGLQLEKELQELKSTLTPPQDGAKPEAVSAPKIVAQTQTQTQVQAQARDPNQEQAALHPADADQAPFAAEPGAKVQAETGETLADQALRGQTSIASDPTQPWDADAVNALADLYASGEEGLPPTRLRDPDQDEVAADAPSAPQPGPQISTIDPAWLEARFADVAARVEMSLADVQNRFSMEELDARFDQLEDRIAVALEEAAAQPDAEGLSAIEGHLADLTNHVQETQTQLARLDGIEDQIGEVVRQLSAQGDIVRAFDIPSAQPDIQEIAETVADRFARKLADERPQVDTAQATQQLNGLQTLLEGYMDERREGEKNTSGALDTMQSALIHLLERVDAMEVSIVDAPPSRGAPVQKSSRKDQHVAAADENTAVPGHSKLSNVTSEETQSAFNLSPATPAAQHFVRETGRSQADRKAQSIAQVDAVIPPDFNRAADVTHGLSPVAQESARKSSIQPDALIAQIGDGDDLVDGRSGGRTEIGVLSASSSRPSEQTAVGTEFQLSPGSHGAQENLVAGAGREDFVAQARRAQKLADRQGEQNDKSNQHSHQGQNSQSNPVASNGRVSRAAQDGRHGNGGRQDVSADAGLRARLSGSAGAAKSASAAGQSATSSSVPDLTPELSAIKQTVTKNSKSMPKPLLFACAGLAVVTMGTLLYGKINANSKTTGALTSQIETPREAVAKSIAARAEAATRSQAGQSQAGQSQAGQSQAAAPADVRRSTMPPATGPNNPRPLRPMPSKLTEDSSLMPGQIPSNTAPAGITVHNSRRKLSAAAMQRIIDGQARAEQSARLADQGGPNAAASKVSLAPQSNFAENGDLAAGFNRQAVLNRALNMPPAIIGPLSLRLAAAKGDPSAEFEVAARFAEGKGIKQDYSQAVKWYKRSAARGFAPAQYRLGTLFERGMGVDTDLPRSRIWYLRAAKQGNVKAMHNLAVLSAGRNSGAPDYASAVQWFTEAGERGLADSQFNLGILYQSGLGVVASSMQSYKWFSLAASRGDKQAAVRADALRRQMTPAQLTSAERLVRSWRQTPVERMVNDPLAAGRAWSSSSQRPKSAG